MKKVFLFLLSIIFLFSPIAARDKKVSFDGKASWSYVKDLAADSMRGRMSGQIGGVMGEEYVASRLKEWGLEPAGEKGTYFQNITMEHFNIEEGVILEVISNQTRRMFYYGEDWQIRRFSGSGHFTGEIVFIGYGIHAPEKSYDDYAGIDVKGKLVLFSDIIPPGLAEKFGDEIKIETRISTAQKAGARGAMIFNNTSELRQYVDLWDKKELYQKNFVLLSIEDKIVDFIFKDLKTELRHLMREIDEKSKPLSYETGIKAFVSLNTTMDEKRHARNVLAKISGSDRNLKDEYIVIGAHMDHLGINPMGEVMNGANDNASGTAVVMEIARIMKINQARPKRSIIFALWAGEEQGLLGSKYYGEHPLFPMEKTVVNFNMDMVGHGNGKVRFRGIYYAPEIWKILKKKLPKKILDYLIPSRGFPGGSDQTPFLDHGVPGFFIQTDGSHLKYHHSRDDIDLIKPELLKKTGDFIHTAVKIMASEEGNFLHLNRRALNHLKYQILINFSLSPLNAVLKNYKDVKNSHVDLQLSLCDEREGLSEEELRLDILDNILSASNSIKDTDGLTFYSSPDELMGRFGRGQEKTTVMTGLMGFNSFRNEPKWTRILAKVGIYYIIEDNPAALFQKKDLSENGKKILTAINNSGILLMIKNLDSCQVKTLLNSSKTPLIFIYEKLPDKDVLEMINTKKSVLGLILSDDENSYDYFNKLEKAREVLGSDNLMIVNEGCLWKKQGKEQMIQLISEILKAGYGSMDIYNLFSATFLRVLCRVRGEKPPEIVPFMPLR